MSEPVRIQRKRTKGFKTPENTVYVGRGTKWGNPFKLVGDNILINARYRRWNLDPWVWYCIGNIEEVVTLYSGLLDKTTERSRDVNHWIDHFAGLNFDELRGKNLSCFCPLDKPCHADVLLKLANDL